ncbi:MAG TPA: hypothetical protein PLN43_13580, partial [Anaerolineales bacterium]|nr:hypothetical protein [Anaerolineales bacterium]
MTGIGSLGTSFTTSFVTSRVSPPPMYTCPPEEYPLEEDESEEEELVDDLFKAAPAAPTIPPILPVEGLGELDGLLEDEDED